MKKFFYIIILHLCFSVNNNLLADCPGYMLTNPILNESGFATISLSLQNGNGNFEYAVWNFGDGSSPVTTTGPSVNHQYLNPNQVYGSYISFPLEITYYTSFESTTSEGTITQQCSKTINSSIRVIFSNVCPTLIFSPVNVECGTGKVNTSAIICNNISNAELSFITWNMGDGSDAIETEANHISYTYQTTGNYTITAVGSFLLPDGQICESTVEFHSGTEADFNSGAICSSPMIASSIAAQVSILNGFISLNTEGGAYFFDTPYQVIVTYSGNMYANVTDYVLYDNGVAIASGNPLPSSGAVLTDVTFTSNSSGYTETQHIFELVISDSKATCVISFPLIIDIIDEPEECEECFTFKPEVGKRYWVSAWVKEDQVNQVLNYEDGAIEIAFTNSGSNPAVFKPTGEIIEGWQRIVGDFVIPTGTTAIDIQLSNDSDIDIFYDDIRIHPFNASMKSYVYDPITFLLVAELDDNNYATFYEYDFEGQLIRIKKETARGIMTIQESRSSNPKQ
jgi:hypothetical protein